MTLRVFILFFSILGVSASFMPWIYFPKSDMSFSGYKADGFLTGLLFLLTLFVTILHIKKTVFPRFASIFISLSGILLAFLSIYKLIKFEESISNFNFENPLMGAAFAGVQPGVGVYIMGLAGLGVFIFSSLLLYIQSNSNATTSENKAKGFLIAISSMILILIILAWFVFWGNTSHKPDAESLRPVLTAETEKMGNALFNENYAEFVDFNHLIMIQSLGGKEKMIEMLRKSMSGLKESGTILKGITLSDIYDIQRVGRNVQVVITQVLLYETNGVEITEIQKMLVVSEDNMKTWKFINITGKTKEEIKKFFPSINEDIKF